MIRSAPTPADPFVEPIVSFFEITKVYPPQVIALDGVSVDIFPGTIHAFVGENGAGKSTLMKVLSGEVRADAGTVSVAGRSVSFHSARAAMETGIGMVHQEILLVDELTVAENIILGVEPLVPGLFGLGRVDRSAARQEVLTTIESFDVQLDPDALVGELTVAAKQKVEICKLLHRHVEILILDEPTAVLTPQEIPPFFAELRRLRDLGKTICFISHHLDEVIALCDTVTVLRDGKLIVTQPVSSTTTNALARAMVDRDVVFTAKRSGGSFSHGSTPVLQLEGLISSTRSNAFGLGPLDLAVFPGEIVGVAGVDGNGQAELVRCITGDLSSTGGSISIGGQECTRADILTRRQQMAFVPSERKTMGGSVQGSLVENSSMTHHRLSTGFRSAGGWLLNRATTRTFAEQIRGGFDVASESIDQSLGSLSGGNQQKVILGRELSKSRPFVLLDQPTRGLDVGSIEYVHQQILAVPDANRGVLLLSSDLEELLRLSDRIVVLFRGTIALNKKTSELTIEELGAAMLEGPLV
jgi:general nucleoside transport system ATP-binding protein